MTTLIELFQLIQKTLASQGFKLSNYFNNTYKYAQFVLDDELRQEPLAANLAYKALTGNSIEVTECLRRNGSKQNVSYYIAITKWERSSNHDLKKIKLQMYQTEPTLVNKITKLALEYKNLIADNKVLQLIDGYLDEIR